MCSAGFKITFLGVDPADFSNDGTATYHYRICDAHSVENECPFDPFRELSHFDGTFPKLGASCLSTTTQISGSCTPQDNTPSNGHSASVGNFGPGDSSCFDKTCGGVQGGTTCNNNQNCAGNPDGTTCITGGSNFVAKCDTTDIREGDCILMDLTIAGELTDLGTGATVVVDKESTSCTASCMAGPSCDGCPTPPPPPGGDECLTRTRGFWGTHPHIADDYLPVTVCSQEITKTEAGVCSTSEALCTLANDYKQNPDYLTLIAQLTAAKLNLNATRELFEGASCSSYKFGDKSIQTIIAECEAICNPSAKKGAFSACITALDDFNNSHDTGFDVTPEPFDKPGPANPADYQAARGNGKAIGVNLTCPAP